MRRLAMIAIAACGAPAPPHPHENGPLVAASSSHRPPLAIEHAKWSALAGVPELTPSTFVVTLDDHRIAIASTTTLAGAIYDANTESWQAIAPPAKIPAADVAFSSLEHAGDYLLVMPRMRYHLGQRAWLPIDPDGAPHAASRNFVIGDKIIELIAPVQNGIKDTATFAYEPAADRWDQLDMLPAVPAICATHSTIAAWSGEPDSNYQPWKLVDAAFAFDPHGTWQPLPTAGRPSARAYASIACGDNTLYVWGGAGSVTTYRAMSDLRRDGAVYDFATKQWHALPPLPDALKLENHAAAVIGDRLIVLAYQQEPGAVYDRGTNTWTMLASAGAPAIQDYSAKMFPLAGDRMLVVGAGAAAGYDFATHTWTPIEFPYITYRGIAFLGDRLVVIGALRPADRTGCYDNAAGRCDDGKTFENVVLR